VRDTNTAGVNIRALRRADVDGCERVLRSLPRWFGIEESNRRYLRDLEDLPTLIAEADGEVIGFLTIRDHNPVASEIHVLAVHHDRRRSGIGSMLVTAAEAEVLARGVRLLQVKTLGPSNPDEGYRQTRAFYHALGFLPLEETTAFWGEAQPTLIMVKLLPEISTG
jgi:N-acetylglutamate synthase-like GNAT family acetyltransferase